MSCDVYLQVEGDKVQITKQKPLPVGAPSRKSEHQKPVPLSPVTQNDVIKPSDIKIEVSKFEKNIVASSSQRNIFTSETSVKSGPESQFKSNYVKEVRTPTEFPDPRSPTSKFREVTEEIRTPTEFTDPRSPTTKFTKFDTEVQRTVTTARSAIQNGEVTTQVTQSKSSVPQSDERTDVNNIKINVLSNELNTLAAAVNQLKIEEPEIKVNTKVTESFHVSEDGESSSHLKAREQSAVPDDPPRSLFTKQEVSIASTINQASFEPVSVDKS